MCVCVSDNPCITCQGLALSQNLKFQRNSGRRVEPGEDGVGGWGGGPGK